MARKGKNRGKNNNYNRPNIWGMIQNVLIQAMNKGQLLPVTLALGFILMVVKLPNDQVLSFGKEILYKLETFSYLGWVLTALVTGGWYFNAKRLRKNHTVEMQRITDEKNRLQEELTKRKLRSSN